ncbi:Antilisterial bacteriocin subtilosin biosynthesis protein AlbA [bacterium HR19]|nr:Antilisterial bacteriocin subtilosin biosynthesis protein AlbA [bacterium HR19]
MLRITNLVKASLSKKVLNPSERGVVVILNITLSCNLRCSHCYISAGFGKDFSMDIPTIKKLADEFEKIGVISVVISGGEPLMHPKIFEIADIFKDKGLRVNLSSNGTLINSKNFKKLKVFDYIGISIDGPEEIHDEFRGVKGAFSKSLKSLRICVENGFPVGVRLSITHKTADFIPFIFDLAEKIGVPKVYFSHLVGSGRGRYLEQTFKDKAKKAVELIVDRAIYYVLNNIQIDVVTGNNETDAVILYEKFSRDFEDYKDYLLGNLRAWGGNQAGVRLMNIDPFGFVKPDPFFPISIGNIHQKSLYDIWNDERNQILSFLRKRPRDIVGECRTCKFLQICNGSSRARALILTGKINSPDPACHIIQSGQDSQSQKYEEKFGSEEKSHFDYYFPDFLAEGGFERC